MSSKPWEVHYEQNLKTSFIGIYHFLRIKRVVEELRGQTFVDLFAKVPYYSKRENFNCTPYMVNFEGTGIRLYWPKIDVEKAILDSKLNYEPNIQVIDNLKCFDLLYTFRNRENSFT